MGSLELAPAVVVRIAAWPLGAITCLGRRPPGDESLGDDGAHQRVVDHERAILWQRTVGDPRFLRALALANPELARSLLGAVQSKVRNKRARHLETTLYRYLARAVARTQPGDMWTTITLARWGRRLRSSAREGGRCIVAPDLAPFRSFVLALANLDPYPERSSYKLNPTLARQGDGAWLMWSAPGPQSSRQRRLAPSPHVDAILDTLAGAATWTRPDACTALAQRLGVDTATARRTVDRLCDQGALVGGLMFPRRFTTAWDALEQVERELEPIHVRPWRRARLRLADLAEQLRAAVLHGGAVEVLRALDDAQAELRTLAQALGVPDAAAPRSALRCDLESPWQVELGPAEASAVERSIRAYLRYQAQDGLHRPLLQASIDDQMRGDDVRPLGEISPRVATVADAGVATWESVVGTIGASSEARARLERLGERLETALDDSWARPAGRGCEGPRLAALHYSFVSTGTPAEVLVHGLGLDATAAYARFSALLASDADDGLEPWFRRCHHRLHVRTGAEPVALVYDHPTPNVMAQPELCRAVLDPWGITRGQVPDRGLRLALDAASGGIVVWTDGATHPVVVHAPTAANPRSDDPCLHALLLSTMHLPPAIATGSPPVHAREIVAPRHRPRLRLDDGTVVQARRTVVCGAELEELVASRGARRFARWQRLAAAYRWPELLSLAHGSRSPLLVHRDSPLAIEAAFEGLAGVEALLVEEHARAAWIGDPADDDRAFLADLVLPFAYDLDDAAAEVGVDATPPSPRLVAAG